MSASTYELGTKEECVADAIEHGHLDGKRGCHVRLTNLLRAYAGAAERGIPKDYLALELQFWVDEREAARLAGDKKAKRRADDFVKEYEQFILLAEQGEAGSNTPPR